MILGLTPSTDNQNVPQSSADSDDIELIPLPEIKLDKVDLSPFNDGPCLLNDNSFIKNAPLLSSCGSSETVMRREERHRRMRNALLNESEMYETYGNFALKYEDPLGLRKYSLLYFNNKNLVLGAKEFNLHTCFGFIIHVTSKLFKFGN